MTKYFTQCLRLELNNLSVNLPFEDPLKDRYNSGQRLKDDKMENLYKVKYLLDGINNFEICDYQRSQLILLQE